MQDLTITIIQQDLVWEDNQKNLKRFDAKLDQVSPDTDLVILPEMFNTGFSVKSDKYAQTSEGEAFVWLKKKASEMNLVITGSIFTSVNGQVFNRLYWVYPDGDYSAYDKRHLFRFGGEHKILSQGNKRLIAGLKGWKIMPLICYDLRFPVWSKNRFNQNTYEYDLLVYVANWPASRKYAWKNLLIARAIENQAYCVGVNRVGTDIYGIQHSGDSLILDPKGQILAQCKPFTEEILTATLHYDELEKFRKEFPVGLDWDEYRVKNL